MKIRELSIQSQRKIIKNVLNCLDYAKYFNSVDEFLNNHYDDRNKLVDIFSNSNYLHDGKAENIINIAITNTLNSDVNDRLTGNDYQGSEYSSDSHLKYAILSDDKELAQELILKGAIIGEEEIQLATTYGRANILEILCHEKQEFNTDKIMFPSSYSPARLFWAPAQRFFGYQADYNKCETLLKRNR